MLATVGALRFLFLGAVTRAPRWHVAVPVLALALVLYTIYKNAVGLEAPYSWFPYVVAAWLAIGLAVVMLSPALVDRVRDNLARSEVQADTAPEASSTAARP